MLVRVVNWFVDKPEIVSTLEIDKEMPADTIFLDLTIQLPAREPFKVRLERHIRNRPFGHNQAAKSHGAQSGTLMETFLIPQYSQETTLTILHDKTVTVIASHGKLHEPSILWKDYKKEHPELAEYAILSLSQAANHAIN